MKKINKLTGRWIEEGAEVAMVATTPKKRKPAKATKKPKTYVVMLMDKSSSMSRVRDSARDFFNQQVEEIKQSTDDQDVSVSLIMFDSVVRERYFNADLEILQPLSYHDYAPGGMTALNDAIGGTLDRMKINLSDLGEDHVSILFVVVTDGHENASRTYTNTGEIRERIENLQSSGRWTFSYMGSDHNAHAAASRYSIPKNNTLQFDKSRFKAATGRTRTATNDYFKSRKLGQKSSDQFYDKKI